MPSAMQALPVHSAYFLAVGSVLARTRRPTRSGASVPCCLSSIQSVLAVELFPHNMAHQKGTSSWLIRLMSEPVLWFMIITELLLVVGSVPAAATYLARHKVGSVLLFSRTLGSCFLERTLSGL